MPLIPVKDLEVGQEIKVNNGYWWRVRSANQPRSLIFIVAHYPKEQYLVYNNPEELVEIRDDPRYHKLRPVEKRDRDTVDCWDYLGRRMWLRQDPYTVCLSIAENGDELVAQNYTLTPNMAVDLIKHLQLFVDRSK